MGINLNNFTGVNLLRISIIDICMMYVNANNDNRLLASQKHLAAQSLVIVTTFAKTGVTAVIDEATGYNKEKNRANFSHGIY